MNGGRESRRPRPALGCSAIDDDDYDDDGLCTRRHFFSPL
jgi:hypothetical protein